jgi:cellulose biosynthesis protein BcsQ
MVDNDYHLSLSLENALAYLDEARIMAAADNKAYADISRIARSIQRVKERIRKRSLKIQKGA